MENHNTYKWKGINCFKIINRVHPEIDCINYCFIINLDLVVCE